MRKKNKIEYEQLVDFKTFYMGMGLTLTLILLGIGRIEKLLTGDTFNLYLMLSVAMFVLTLYVHYVGLEK